MGRPVITSDTVGCRQAVDEGATGLLCQPRDASDLAGRMLQMIELGPQGRQQLGLAGRAKMEREFDERAVIDAYRQRVEFVQRARAAQGCSAM
jgi:glycosyltransferase involved in cell wall biosynthesis